MTDAIVLCHLDDFAIGTSRGFDPWREGRDTVFAVRDAAGVRVFRNICPHQGAPLGWRKDRFLTPDGAAIMCFAHGARFDIVSGLCVAGPCPGDSLDLVFSYVDNGGFLVIPAGGTAA